MAAVMTCTESMVVYFHPQVNDSTMTLLNKLGQLLDPMDIVMYVVYVCTTTSDHAVLTASAHESDWCLRAGMVASTFTDCLLLVVFSMEI